MTNSLLKFLGRIIFFTVITFYVSQPLFTSAMDKKHPKASAATPVHTKSLQLSPRHTHPQPSPAPPPKTTTARPTTDYHQPSVSHRAKPSKQTTRSHSSNVSRPAAPSVTIRQNTGKQIPVAHRTSSSSIPQQVTPSHSHKPTFDHPVHNTGKNERPRTRVQHTGQQHNTPAPPSSSSMHNKDTIVIPDTLPTRKRTSNKSDKTQRLHHAFGSPLAGDYIHIKTPSTSTSPPPYLDYPGDKIPNKNDKKPPVTKKNSHSNTSSKDTSHQANFIFPWDKPDFIKEHPGNRNQRREFWKLKALTGIDLRKDFGIPQDVTISSAKDLVDFVDQVNLLGGDLTSDDWRSFGQGNGDKVINDIAHGAFGVSKDVTISSAKDLVDFIEQVNLLGGDLTSDDWRSFGQGNGDKVINEMAHGAFGISQDVGKGVSVQDLAKAAAAGQHLGLGGNAINDAFISDVKNVNSGGMSGLEFIGKYGPPGAASSAVGLGNGNSNTTGSNPGGNLPGTGGNNDSTDSSTSNSTGSSHTNEEDNGTRDINHDNDVVNFDDSDDSDAHYQGDHNEDIDSASQGTDTSTGNGPAGDAGSGEEGSTAPDEYIDIADSIMENNSGDDGFIIIITGSEDDVQTVDATQGAIVITAGEGVEEDIDPNTFYHEDNSESGTGVPEAWGMNGPEDDFDDDNSDDNSNSSNASSSSDNSSDDSSSSDNSSESSSTDEDDAGRPNPMADEQGVCDEECQKNTDLHGNARQMVGQPGPDNGNSVNVDNLPLIDPNQLYRRGVDEAIHTTGDESPSDEEITAIDVGDATHQLTPSHSRGGIEMPPDSNSGGELINDNLLGEHPSGNDNPQEGDPRAHDDND